MDLEVFVVVVVMVAGGFALVLWLRTSRASCVFRVWDFRACRARRWVWSWIFRARVWVLM